MGGLRMLAAKNSRKRIEARRFRCGVMILRSNLVRLRKAANAAARVLDIGGWYQPFNLATHVVDLLPYTTRRQHEALDPQDAERFPPRLGSPAMSARRRGPMSTDISTS